MRRFRHCCGVAAIVSVVGPATVLGQSAPSAAEPRLLKLVGRWVVVSSSFGMPSDGSVVSFTAEPTAGGRAVRSLWAQGSGATRYEASALWAFSAASRQIRVMEANTLGVAEMHVGGFDDEGILRVELRDVSSGLVRERRAFTWKGDTLFMSARFVRDAGAIEHTVTMTRRP